MEDWLHQNSNLQGQALTDAAQQHGFDPAFVSLVNFPTVIEMMATNIDDYAALGDAFRANQQSVMTAIQTLRQDAYSKGALDSNEYQTVSVQQQGNVQVVVVQPTNPQVVFVPQYQPQQVWSSGPSSGDVFAASMLSFGAGIALGSWLNNSQPWGWGGWGWGWGGRGMIVHNNVWVVNNRWRSPRNNWHRGPPRWVLRSMRGRLRIGINGLTVGRHRRDGDPMGRTIVRVQAIDQAPDLTPSGIVPVGIPGATREGIGLVGIQAAIARVGTLAATVLVGMLEAIHLAETPAGIAQVVGLHLGGMLEATDLGRVEGRAVRQPL